MHSILQIDRLLQQQPHHHLIYTSLHLRQSPHKHHLHTSLYHLRQPSHRHLLHTFLHHPLHILVMSILHITTILLIMTIPLIIFSSLHQLMQLKVLTPHRIIISLMRKNHRLTCHSSTTLRNSPISSRILALQRAVFLLHHHITLLTIKALMLRIPQWLHLAV